MVFDPRMPDRVDCVLAYQLERWAMERADEIAVLFHDGKSWTWREALDEVRRTAHFMLPRYIRITDSLPKTPTQKVRKHLLKTESVTPDTWDRQAAGVEIRRERIGR